MNIRFASLSLFLALILGHAVLPAQSPETFKVMTWNLENFTDPFDDPYIDTADDNLGSSKTHEQLTIIARNIQYSAPDVIAFQEVEDDRTVKLFLDSYFPDHPYKHIIGMGDHSWHQTNVIASRFPVGTFTALREVSMYNEVLDSSDNKYNTKLIMAEIIVSDDYRFNIVNLHLKAGRDDKDRVWRTKQIGLVKDMVSNALKVDEDLNVIVLGDFNLEFGMPEYDEMRTGGAVALVDPSEGTGTTTHPSRGPNRQIDYIMFNENMAPEYIQESAAIASAVGIQDLSTVSDHLPLVATFKASDE